MTDRINYFVVALENDVCEEEAKRIADILGMVRGVVLVTPNVVNINARIERARIRIEVREEFTAMYNRILDTLT
jgi:hypothetical protein